MQVTNSPATIYPSTPDHRNSPSKSLETSNAHVIFHPIFYGITLLHISVLIFIVHFMKERLILLFVLIAFTGDWWNQEEVLAKLWGIVLKIWTICT